MNESTTLAAVSHQPPCPHCGVTDGAVHECIGSLRERLAFVIKVCDAEHEAAERCASERDRLRFDVRDMLARGDAYMEEVSRLRAQVAQLRAELGKAKS